LNWKNNRPVAKKQKLNTEDTEITEKDEIKPRSKLHNIEIKEKSNNLLPLVDSVFFSV
jgi:hypothetical protein